MSLFTDTFLDDSVPRIIGLVVAFLVTWVNQRWGYQLDQEQLTTAFVAIYAVVHRAFAAKRDALRAKRGFYRSTRRHRDD